MATTNPTITTSWAQIVAADDEFFLSFLTSGSTVEIATTTSGAPSVVGHRLSPGLEQVLTRQILGPGIVWAKADSASTTVALSSWTP